MAPVGPAGPGKPFVPCRPGCEPGGPRGPATGREWVFLCDYLLIV